MFGEDSDMVPALWSYMIPGGFFCHQFEYNGRKETQGQFYGHGARVMVEPAQVVLFFVANVSVTFALNNM